MTTTQNLGDRMKFYENMATKDVFPSHVPIIARLDGKSFSKFTKRFEQPFDSRLHQLLVETADFLMKISDARCAFIQSDEISLGYYSTNPQAESFYGGRVFKINTFLAAQATAYFNVNFYNHFSTDFSINTEKRSEYPSLDCRSFVVPSLYEAVECFVWRQRDCSHNSISKLASCHYSHNQLMNKSSADKLQMLSDGGQDWNNYPLEFKCGTFIVRTEELSGFTPKEIEKLGDKHPAKTNPDYKVVKKMRKTAYFPSLQDTIDVTKILFGV